ncbi:MAG TPA: Gfo/Idh/MocA family oxidoreductase, partial [Gemmatimonadaceae bacterium]|nr:Gfo/Idh/MocA family oxidoreductase [Gemmatimonadaceae bacterium]
RSGALAPYPLSQMPGDAHSVTDERVAPVRWGILGAAGIALRKAIPGMQRSALAQVVAIASRDIAKARAAASELGIPRAYGSYQELIDDPDVEAIYIPLPNHLHVPWSIRAAERGKHVLCEKPIALTAKEARQLLAARDRTGVKIGEAFMVRTHPQWLKVKEIIASGRIGDLRLISGHFSYYRRDPADVRSRVEWGGGALLDIGCYPITMSRWLFGAEPTEVIGLIDRDPQMKIDRLTSGLLRFERGQATFSCAMQLVAFQAVQIFGTEGRIAASFHATPRDASRIYVDDGSDLIGGGGVETITFQPVDQFTIQANRFSRAIRGVGTVPVSLEDAIGNMAVIDALFRSAESGRWERPES